MSNHLGLTRTVVLVLLLTVPARAQSPADKMAAESLFDAGRRLLDEGKPKEACLKLEQSQGLDPGIGTLLYLGECYEMQGRFASAWAAFREAMSGARARGQTAREEGARERIASLEQRLAKLVVSVPIAARLSGLEVKRDEAVVAPALWDEEVALDPGVYEISATAPGRQTFRRSVEIPSSRATIRVEIPLLEPVPTPVAETAPEAPPPRPTPAAARPRAEAERTPSDSGATERAVAVGLGGVALVSFGVGTWAALSAQSSWKDSRSHCNGQNQCDATGLDMAKGAGTKADVATVALIVGAASAGAGLWLWLSSAEEESTEPRVGVGARPGAVVVGGVF